ncbi:hypothetical protein [Actinomadura xylanilytica]|uniref:hypothetical protein n=1 Tax=Actinomadura xylanilytica TaxID=887459 RepID=UPI00255A97D3|nr:hypothetical protein [Actinomadura xylanilytica]MDL4772821.1 hypothetical protein [Actinomadura xylanilytica]
MLRTSALHLRVNAVETYVGMTEDSTGMTVAGRLDAHHRLLQAMQATQADQLRRLTAIEAVLTRSEDTLGRLLGEVTESGTPLRRPRLSQPKDSGLPPAPPDSPPRPQRRHTPATSEAGQH